MKKNKFSAIWMLCLLLSGSTTFTACSEDDLDTNQYKNEVSLNAYGPIPVLRGGTLRFLGSNLEQISQVQLPGADPITSIEIVKSGIPSEIRVIVPHDNCQEGTVVLVAKNGKEIMSKTPISYIEGLDPENITIPTMPVMPGQTIRITVPEDGDEYLDMIHMVEFEKGVQVGEEQFTVHNRYVIELPVPQTAMTGKLNLYSADLTVAEIAESNVDYQIITTKTALIVSTPVTSKVGSPRGEVAVGEAVTAKQGETITLTGTMYDLIESIHIGDVEIAEFTKTSTSISFILPAEAADEAITLVCSSGVELPVATLATIAPANLSVAPSPVKAGTALTVSGTDMDVVASVELPNGGTLSGDDIAVAADKVVVKSVPEQAIEGNLSLHMANGKTVEAAYKLVVPTATGYSSTTVNAGAPLTINGTDLDLVKTVQFGDGSDEVAVSGSATSIEITTVPMNAKSGKPTLTLANGTTIEGPELSVNEALFCYITEMPSFDDDTTPKAGTTLAVPVANSDKLTGVQINGIDCQFILTAENSLIIGIPEEATASSVLRLISSNGEVSYDIAVIPSTEVTLTLWSGLIDLAWNLPNAIYLTADAFADVPAGARMTLYYTLNPAVWTQIWFEAGDDVHLVFTDTSDGALAFDRSIVPTDIYGWDNNNVRNLETTVVLTQDVLDLIREKNVFNIRGGNGGGLFLTKLTVSWKRVLEKDIAPFINNMDGTPVTYPYTLTWGNEGRFSLSKELLLNEFKVKKGSKLLFYKDKAVTGQVQVNDNNWTTLEYLTDWGAEKDVLEKVFDDAMMEAVNNGGLIIQGGLSGITKMAILP